MKASFVLSSQLCYGTDKRKRTDSSANPAFNCLINKRGSSCTLRSRLYFFMLEDILQARETTFICIEVKTYFFLSRKLHFFPDSLYITNVRVRQILDELYDKNPISQENISNIFLLTFVIFFKSKADMHCI